MPAEREKRIAEMTPLFLKNIPYFSQNFGRVESHWKNDGTRVTDADLSLSKSFAGAISSACPGDDFVSEEALPKNDTVPLRARFCWVLDPIDGTNNYARGLPMCAISLALLEDGIPVYGWIYDHLSRRLLDGGPGLGLRSDGKKMAPPPASVSFDKTQIITLHFPLREPRLSQMTPFLARNPVRCFGSAALNLAYNALGHIDGSADFFVRIWDIAAAHALLSAAGRRIIFLKNDPYPLREISGEPPVLELIAGSEAFLDSALKAVSFNSLSFN